MTMKKKILTTLSVVLILGLAALGILAYLQSEDSDVNVMTLGNVSIEQIEQERGETGELQKFTQEKPAFPAVGPIEWADEGVDVNGTKYKVFTDDLKNVVDKIVTVNNTGKSDAYVRTLVAIEAPGYDPKDLIHINWNGTDTVMSDPVNTTIDGIEFVTFAFTYKEALAAEKESAPSLMQVFLDSKATNEDVAKFGDTWEIRVLSQAVQVEGFENASAGLDTAFGVVNEANVVKWFSGMKPSDGDTWDGASDPSWYNDTDTEFVITTAEQLAGLAELVDNGNNFAGKTIKLGNDIDLYYVPEGATEPKCFDPIGSYRKDTPFKGTFDGQGYTVKNLNQNTWALDNGYAYGDLGLGLFGKVEDATIKNLNMDGASISGESGLCGTVAATAYGECTFENITITNSDVADYQYYAGGVVGWASGNHKYRNCDVDDSTTIAGQWGDFNNANGGIIGGTGSGGTYYFEDCDVACVIDVHNDVVSAYQWYSYRRSGMLVGDTGHTKVVDGTTYADAPNITAKDCTVTYGEWANYHYCKFNAMGYPWVRVEAGLSVDAYTNIRYGHPTDANGNTVMDDNHTHNAGEAHKELIVFDQLFGGKTGDRYCTYGTATHPGVTVIYNNK